jgi:hypothetical protein
VSGLKVPTPLALSLAVALGQEQVISTGAPYPPVGQIGISTFSEWLHRLPTAIASSVKNSV